MRSFRWRAYISLVAFLAFLAAGYGGAAGKVLCIGGDGHVSLEPALNGLCSVASVPAAPSGVDAGRHGYGAAMRASHCGPCVDYPVLANDSGLRASHPVFSKARPASFSANSSESTAGSWMPGMTAAPLHPGMRNDFPVPASVSLRSIVLLI